jgi:hypothetical protein
MLLPGLSWITIIAAVLVIAALMSGTNRGLDYSDDAYSYLWARYPFDYRFALRLSGFVVHPIELLCNHSITALRIAGVLLTVAGGFLVGIIVTRNGESGDGRLRRAEIALTCAVAMLMGNIFWMNTPSYQHVTTWGMTLFVSGAALLISGSAATALHRFGAALLIASGGLLIALAKIPSALAAAILAVMLVLFAYPASRSAKWQMLGLLVVVEALLLAFIALLVSPLRLIDLLREGVSLRAGYGGLQEALARNAADAAEIASSYLWTMLFAAASMLTSLAAPSLRQRFGAGPAIAATVLAGLATYRAIANINPVKMIFGRYNVFDHGIHVIVLALAALALALAIRQCQNSRSGRNQLLYPLLLTAVPLLAGLATGNNFLQHTAVYAGFPALAIVFSTLEMPGPVAQVARLLVTLLSGATLYLAAMHPYRLDKPIFEQTVPVALSGLNGETLQIDAPTADFFTRLRDGAQAAGLSKGTPLFDLSGLGPGSNLVLGTRPPVYPWIAAGYPNSPAILDKVWSQTPEADRRRAWIVGPIDKSFLGATALNALAPFETNYELVLKVVEPQSRTEIELWRPRTSTSPER